MVEKQCDVCHVGVLHTKRVTYATPVDGYLVIAPGFTVQVCDACGEHRYDLDSLERIQLLVGVDLVSPEVDKRRGAAGDAPAGHSHADVRRRSV